MSKSDKKFKHKKNEMDELIKRKKDENEALKNILQKLKENPLKYKTENNKNK